MNKAALLLSFSLALPAFAQTTQPSSETPFLIHERHTHPRNAKPLPSVIDPARFDTSRKSPITLKLPTEDASFTFAILGDRTTGPEDGVNILADAVRDVNLLEPDLVMTIGDLVQGYNETPLWTQQAREYRAIMNHLQMPWFPTAGNHDVYWRDKDASGDAKPAGENDSNYEQMQGPLWYAFEHKNSWFIVLFTDEGDKEKNAKGFGDPELQKMSDDQFNWLKGVLAKAKRADHIFVFQHHPRWMGTRGAHEGYGDDWNRIHKAFVDNGNVAAVFAGHIHFMQSTERDGILYTSLATTGGAQGGQVPMAGKLHHYNLVTVRKDRVSMAAFPVGSALDVRDLTEDVVSDTLALTRVMPTIASPIMLNSDGSAKQAVEIKIKNPGTRAIDYTLSLDSRDSRWAFPAEPVTTRVEAGSTASVTFNVSRPAIELDTATRLIDIVATAVYPTPTHNYEIPAIRLPVPVNVTAVTTHRVDRDLQLDGTASLAVPATFVKLPGNTFTLEGRFRAHSFKERNGLLSKMQSSGYGIFISNGKLSASVHMGEKYLTAKTAKDLELKVDQWYHVAQVYDGNELRLYLDGKLVGSAKQAGTIKDNDLPLILGGDVDGSGRGVDTLDGELDDVRLSSNVLYTGDRFEPAAFGASDAATLLQLDMNQPFGQWLMDSSAAYRAIALPATVRFAAK